jgi:hypothetical protein
MHATGSMPVLYIRPISRNLDDELETGTVIDENYECPECNVVIFGMANFHEHRKNDCLEKELPKQKIKTYR